MPPSHRQSPANLRRARSIPANILQSSKAENEPPKTSQQYALVAANRAFQLAKSAKEDERTSNVAAAMPQRRDQRGTDDTLVHYESTASSETADGTSRDGRSAPFSNVRSNAATEGLPSANAQHENVAIARPETRNISVPSSFHKLSKPKSTFSLRKKASPEKLSLPGTSGRETPTLRCSPRRSPVAKSFPTGLSPGRPMPTAEELLSRLPNPLQTTYSQERAVQLAMDEFVRQLQEQQENAVQSATVRTDRSKIARSFRQTMRRTGKINEDNATENGAVERSSADDEPRPRRISGGFRASFKRFFRGRSSRTFPPQQVDAKRKHYDSIQDDDDDANDPIRYPVVPAPSPEMVARLSRRQSHDTYVPSPKSTRQSHPPSIRSVRSSESLRTGSRVTSWANSATSKGTHLTSTLDGAAQDRARLSVIQENAPHRPSASASRQPDSRWLRGTQEEAIPSLRNIHEVDVEKMADGIRDNIRKKCAAAGVDDYNDTPRSGSTIRQRAVGGTARHHGRCFTLRTDGSDEDDSPPQPLSYRKRRGITYPSSDDDDVFEPSIPRLRWHGHRSLRHKLSLQDIANLNEGQVPSHRPSLRESRSTFFPGKGQYPNYQLSPYRKAMKVNVEQGPSDVGSSERDITPLSAEETESLYSRKTTGTPYANAILDQAENDAGHGIAYVNERPINHYRSLVGKVKGVSRSASHRSSGSWQGWVASEVSKLETSEGYNTDISLPQDQPGMKGIGHVREDAEEQAPEPSDRGSLRTTSGSRPALDAVRFFSGFRLPRRTVSSESKDSHSRRGSFTIRDESDKSSIKSALRIMLPGLRAPSQESVRPNSCAPLLSHKHSEPALKLPTVPESPMTPFSKFHAADDKKSGSPLDGYHLRERVTTATNVRHSPERDNRLRRMQSSTLAGNKTGRHGPSQYPWLQRYRDSHFYEELSSEDRENKPYARGSMRKKNKENEPRPYRGSMDDDRFPDPDPIHYRRGLERSSSGEPAFI